MKNLLLNNRFQLNVFSISRIIIVIILAGCSNCDSCRSDFSRLELPSFKFTRRVRGSGNIVNQTRLLRGFSSVELSEEGDLFIEFGAHEQLIIEAEDNLQEYLIADIEDAVLNIKKYPDKLTIEATQPIHYHLTVTTLKALVVKNSGSVKIAPLKVDTFSVRILSSGMVFLESINVMHLTVELTSSGNLTIKEGTVEDQYVKLSSSGSYNSRGLTCSHANVRISSSGEANLFVSELLEVELSSSGNVYYFGNPLIRIIDSSSEGRVIRGN